MRSLLDSFFDDDKDLHSNRTTAVYLDTLAVSEGLDLESHTSLSETQKARLKAWVRWKNRRKPR